MFSMGIMTIYSQQTSAAQESKAVSGVAVADQEQPASPNPQLTEQEREAYILTLSQSQVQKQAQSDQSRDLDPELNPNKPSTQEPGEMVLETISPSAELDNLPTPNHPNGRKSDTQ
jgi:hypothetical protein